MLELILGLVILCVLVQFLTAERREGFVSQTSAPDLFRSPIPSNQIDQLLSEAVQINNLQLVTPATAMSTKDSTAVVNSIMGIVKAKTGMNLTIITVNSAQTQASGADKLCSFTVSVYDKDRNCMYQLLLSALVDKVGGSVRISRCQQYSRRDASQYEGMSVPGYGFEFGTPY